MSSENGLQDMLDTVLNVKPGYPPYEIYTMQLRDEVKGLSQIVNKQEPKSVLEIGTAKGGSLYIWSRYLNTIENIVSLDLPGGEFGGGYSEQKATLFQNFSPSTKMAFIRDNSHRSEVYEKVKKLADNKFDFIFIDGDHTYDGVKKDFEMYSDLVSEGGIIALHDIVEHPDEEQEVQSRRETQNDLEERHLVWAESHSQCDVKKFWDEEVVTQYETEEIISHEKQTWAGIGVVYM